jgi:hypothetical protein
MSKSKRECAKERADIWKVQRRENIDNAISYIIKTVNDEVMDAASHGLYNLDFVMSKESMQIAHEFSQQLYKYWDDSVSLTNEEYSYVLDQVNARLQNHENNYRVVVINTVFTVLWS